MIVLNVYKIKINPIDLGEKSNFKKKVFNYFYDIIFFFF